MPVVLFLVLTVLYQDYDSEDDTDYCPSDSDKDSEPPVRISLFIFTRKSFN